MLEIIGRISTGLTALMWVISFVLWRKNRTNEKLESIFVGFTFSLVTIGFVACTTHALFG